jgi:hypothetical protein
MVWGGRVGEGHGAALAQQPANVWGVVWYAIGGQKL